MRPDDWHLTDDLSAFLDRAGAFLRSRPALHTVPLTVTAARLAGGPGPDGDEAPLFGSLGRVGEVRAAFFRTPPRRLYLTSLSPEEADALAARLARSGHPLPGVNADHGTAAAFAAAWQRRTDATASPYQRERLYRLGTLTPPRPPTGRGRVADGRDRQRLMRWHREFVTAIGGSPAADHGPWADSRIAHGRVTLWETPGKTPVSMAGRTPLVAGQIRVTPVYTPPHLCGRGYASAVTVEVSRAALAAGAAEVLLFADLANPTSNGLYQRIGYRPVADFAVYDFT
ncbi:GNAT family N-acetyltransferase [Streptomyces buecherae]|uniref:GNAT family N-acetyltransferase n=1 Tax=Streptomyces buecherae TaxID=2763006 RepID=UPI003677B704